MIKQIIKDEGELLSLCEFSMHTFLNFLVFILLSLFFLLPITFFSYISRQVSFQSHGRQCNTFIVLFLLFFRVFLIPIAFPISPLIFPHSLPSVGLIKIKPPFQGFSNLVIVSFSLFGSLSLEPSSLYFSCFFSLCCSGVSRCCFRISD